MSHQSALADKQPTTHIPSMLLKQAISLKGAGQLTKAYELLNHNPSQKIDELLQLALLADLLGKEQQADTLFTNILANKKVSRQVKDNIKRFRISLKISLQKRLKQAQILLTNNNCDQAQLKFKTLLSFNKTKSAATLGLKACQQKLKLHSIVNIFKPIGFSGKLNYRLGKDNNAGADNEELLTEDNQLIDDSFTYLNINAAYKWRIKRAGQHTYIQPRYNYVQKEYESMNAQIYGSNSHKFQISLKTKTANNVTWNLPMSAKWLSLGGKSYAQYQSLLPSVSWPATIGGLSVKNRVQWQIKKRTYIRPDYKAREGISHTLDFDIKLHAWGATFKPQVWFRQQSTKIDNSYAYDAWAFALSVKFQQQKWLYSLWYQYTNYQYQEANPVLANSSLDESYDQARESQREDVRGSIHYQFIKNWQLYFQTSVTQQHSNHAIYQFDRIKSEVGLSFKF